MSNSQQIAERLRAHARLYRHIAEQVWSETRAAELTRLAEDCERAADAISRNGESDAA